VKKEYIESFDNHTVYIAGSGIPLEEVYKEEFFKSILGTPEA
jgi:hypothetical protein